MAALLSLLINYHGQKKGDRHPYKCRAYASGSKKRRKTNSETSFRISSKFRNKKVFSLKIDVF